MRKPMFSIMVVLAAHAEAQPLRLYAVDSIATKSTAYHWRAPRASAAWPDGTLAILDGFEPYLTIVSKGRPPVQLGRRGSGPGEFLLPTTIGVVRDSVWVWDLQLARLTIFDRSGRFARSVTLPTGSNGLVLADGNFASYALRNYQARRARALRDSLVVWRIAAPRRQTQERILVRPFEYSVLEYDREGARIVGVQPFEDGPLFEAFPDGRGFAYLRRDSNGQGPLLTRFDAAGRTLFQVRLQTPPIRITPTHIDSAVQQLLRDGPPTKDAALERSIRRAIKAPTYLPPASAMVLGRDGTIWIRGAVQAKGDVTWTIVDDRGTVSGSLTLPLSFYPSLVRQSEVRGFRLSDETGDGWLVRYRVDR